MKRNKIAFLIAEIVLCVMAVFCINKIFEKNIPEKRVAVIIPNSGDKGWDALIKGLKDSARANEIHLIICNTDDINDAEDEVELINEQKSNNIDGFIICPAPGSNTGTELKKVCDNIPFMLITEDVFSDEKSEKSEFPLIKTNNYNVGYELGKRLVADSGGKEKKEAGLIFAQYVREETADKYKGFCDAIEGTNIQTGWTYNGKFDQDICSIVDNKKKVDYLVVMDNYSLDNLGEKSEAGMYNGAEIYGVGNSMKALNLLDHGNVKCLIVPNGYEIGYSSVSEITKKINNSFYTMKSYDVGSKTIYKNDLFSNEIERFLYSYE